MPYGILGTGCAYPDNIVTNDDLAKVVETNDEWIRTRSGIAERRIATESEAASDFAAEAGRRAIEAAGLEPGDIDLVVVCSFTPDSLMPNTACLVQARLGIPDCAAYDINCACSGFSYGLATAHGLMDHGLARRALVIGADASSKFLDWTDRGTCVLFGDGAGAVVLGEVEPGRGILGELLSADGRGGSVLCIPGGGSRRPANADMIAARDQYMKMDGREVFKFAARVMPQALEEVAARAGVRPADYDWVIPHQANIRIIDNAVKRLKLPPERFIVNLDRFGNTSAASIPIALDEAVRDGRIVRGQLLAFVAFGGGLTWGANVLRY